MPLANMLKPHPLPMSVGKNTARDGYCARLRSNPIGHLSQANQMQACAKRKACSRPTSNPAPPS